ncbi:hypothetical protein AnigIFM62618_001986 [Aspergillus niger]|nr:hypothetical protein AnigIFM62618_001986 [Aspergillus niger]
MSISPPPTPPSRAVTDDEWRFETVTLPCEWVEDYHPGGYHPVVLGDVFNNGQYKVIRKLGEGSYSTVWLACDLRNGGYVALKILVAQLPESTAELHILRHITGTAPTEAAKHVTRLLGEFEHHGPNGVHKCLVFEPMGPSVNSMVEELPQFKPRMFGMKVRYPLWMAKGILKQSLDALTFLHRNGIAHGDFQPGNILFTLKDLRCTPEDVLRQEEDVEAESISPPVQRLDGKEDKWAPRYLCVAQPLSPFTNYTEGFNVKLSDMGGERLGALPDELYRHWKTSSLYFTPDRKLFNCQIGAVDPGEEPHMVEQISMEEQFDSAEPDIDEKEADEVKTLIRWILQYVPAKRPSPEEILSHPWFRNIGAGRI